jgi:hypothetical protein
MKKKPMRHVWRYRKGTTKCARCGKTKRPTTEARSCLLKAIAHRGRVVRV